MKACEPVNYRAPSSFAIDNTDPYLISDWALLSSNRSVAIS